MKHNQSFKSSRYITVKLELMYIASCPIYNTRVKLSEQRCSSENIKDDINFIKCSCEKVHTVARSSESVFSVKNGFW